MLNQTIDQVEKFDLFYEKIFGAVDPDGKRTGGLDHEVEQRKKHLALFEKLQEDKYIELLAKIENLLPGATSAGLATAYGTLANSFDKKIQANTRIFYSAVVAIPVIAFLTSIEQIGFSPFYLIFIKVAGYEEILRLFLMKLPLVVPLIWLAIFASMRRSQYERLQQEYSHKESLAKSYESYKKQLEILQIPDVDTLKKELIAKAVDAISFNASITLNGPHREKLPVEQLLELLKDDKNLGIFEKISSFFKNKEKL